VALTCSRLRGSLSEAPDPMTDLLAQLSQRLGAGGGKRANTCGGCRRAWDQHPDDPDERHPVLPRRGQIHAGADQSFEALIRKPIKELIDELDPTSSGRSIAPPWFASTRSNR
jgi:hypothetical protein